MRLIYSVVILLPWNFAQSRLTGLGKSRWALIAANSIHSIAKQSSPAGRALSQPPHGPCRTSRPEGQVWDALVRCAEANNVNLVRGSTLSLPTRRTLNTATSRKAVGAVKTSVSE